MAKGKLEAEGVPAFIVHEHHIWAVWMYSQALGGVKVQVAEEYVPKAITILDSLIRGEYEREIEDEYPNTTGYICPKCKSNNFKSKTGTGLLILAILTFGLLSIIFPPGRNLHTCLQCRHQWKY
ncbi:MAG TPA: hypothetical protein VGL10_10185 [Gammaproteobacteria bacterium]